MKMKFGVATVDITPPVGVTLWGYDPRLADSVDHALRAEALACEAEGGGWILVSADVGAFSRPLTTQVREDVARRTGLPVAAVMLAATHTHSGPHVTDALWAERSELESAYFQELCDKLADVAERAWRERTLGELVHARTSAPTLAHNRRIQYSNGTWDNEWRDPNGRHTGYYDPTVELLGVRRPDGALAVLLVNYGCHPVCYNQQNHAISADYVGHMKDALEASGDVKTAMFTVSGHANVDPRVCVQTLPDVVRRMGEDLAAVVREAIPRLAPVAGKGAAAVYEPWAFNTTWSIQGRMTIYFPYAGHGDPVQTSFAALAVGDCVLLGMPGETVSEYREKFCSRSPFGTTLVVSLANDFVGYLATDEILAQGAYEADICPLKPIEDVLTANTDAVLRNIHAAVGAAAGTHAMQKEKGNNDA